MDSTTLNLLTWNCKGVMSATLYLSEYLENQNIHVCALTEHWLRQSQIYFLQQINADYKPYAKGIDYYYPDINTCSNYRKGVSLLVHKSIDQFVTGEIDVDSDRIVGVEANLPNNVRLFIFAIYMPASSQPIKDFKDHIDMLHELYSVYGREGFVLFMGDFNVKIRGTRYNFVDNDRTRYTEKFFNEVKLFSVNSDSKCSGPCYTFQGYDNGPTTMIDHIVISNELSGNVLNAQVLEDSAMNVSDHHPVSCSLMLPSPIGITRFDYTSKVSWDRAIDTRKTLDYSFAVSQNLWSIGNQVQDDVETYFSILIKAINKASVETLPYTKYRKHLKPYWNNALSELHREVNTLRQIWTSEGKPRGNNCESFVNYKFMKKTFRDEMRKAYDNYMTSISENIQNSIEVDQKLAWTLINSRKPKQSNCVTLKSGGKVFHDISEVCNEFANHFESIAKVTNNQSDTTLLCKLDQIRRTNSDVKKMM